MDDAFSELAQANAEPRGLLRVTAPYDYGVSVVALVASHFSLRYPACRVELIFSDTRLDLIQHQLDLSIRVGWLDDSSLQARRIGTFRQILVAAPDQARGHTNIEPEQLSSLPFIANAALREPLLWHFSRGDLERRTVKMYATLGMNSSPAIRAAILAGGGMSVLPDYEVIDDLKYGRLVHLLPDWNLPSGGIHAVYPAARFRQPKVTAFVDLLRKEVKSQTFKSV